MRELHQHLLSVLMIGLMAIGASGWRAVHMLEHHSHAAGACGHECSSARTDCGQSDGQAGHPGHASDSAPSHSPAPGKGSCLTCDQLDALTGAPLPSSPVPAFVELVCVCDDVAPPSPAQPAPPRVAGARPPPIL